MQTPFQRLGEDKIRELCDAFYHAMDTLPEAAGIRAMHAKDLGPISNTLAEYLIGWMGGPPRYQDKKGTVCLTDPHAPYHIGPKETEQWLLCFDVALDAINASDDVKNMLHTPIRQVAAAVQNRDHSNAAEQDPNIIAVGRT
jgi:hemoglobin